jgi:hypothetical protein
MDGKYEPTTNNQIITRRLSRLIRLGDLPTHKYCSNGILLQN